MLFIKKEKEKKKRKEKIIDNVMQEYGIDLPRK
jgi:uncharacterized protein YpuA (DUF1002 family)